MDLAMAGGLFQYPVRYSEQDDSGPRRRIWVGLSMCSGENQGGIGVLVNSNPNLPDSDFDSLPDFIERDIWSNPNNPDTDADGLSDFDEFADFARYFGLEQLYSAFFVDGSTSEQYGTNPMHFDTDENGVLDRDERITGSQILLAGDAAFRQILSARKQPRRLESYNKSAV